MLGVIGIESGTDCHTQSKETLAFKLDLDELVGHTECKADI